MDSLDTVLARLDLLEVKLEEERARADSFMEEIGSIQSRLVKLDVIEAKLHAGCVRTDTLAQGVESIKNELGGLSNYIGPRFERWLGRITSWAYFDEAYKVWKLYKKKSISRDDALREIDERFGIRPFFVLLPFFKVTRPFRKRKQKVSISSQTGGNNNPAPVDFDAEWYLKLYPDVKESGMDPLQHYIEFGRAEGRVGSPGIGIEVGPTFDPSKKTILLISHDASQTGAPILAFNLLEKLAPRYNVVTILLGRGALENAFRNASAAIVGLFLDQTRYTSFVHAPLLNVCNRLAPAFAIVNSMESREALIPLSEAKVPSVLLVHEFCSLCQGLDMGRVVAHADQIVFPARRVWEDAVGVFPGLVAYPTNIVTQGQSRIPREWLGGETADDEEKRIAAVMRPDGPDDGAVVVIGCGYFDVRKGIDLFMSTAASLRQRSPSRRYRFVWVGRTSEDLYTAYIATQVKCCGLEETVEFLGEVNSLDPVYAMADIFLLSSRLDPFPNVAIDAMLVGLPLVCFNGASGVAEMLSSHADLKHLVVPYVDTNSAAEVIERLGDDEAHLRRTRDVIRKLALSSFDMDRYVERLEQLAEDASHQ